MNFDIDLGDLEQSAKVDRSGQSKIFTDEELGQIFEAGLKSQRDRALFAICLFTGCRISEALQLTAEMVGQFITFTRDTRKGKTGTQQVEIVPTLQAILDEWANTGEMPKTGYLFKARRGGKKPYMSRAAADLTLRAACKVVGIEGASTHSFRRTYITKLRSKGYSPAQIQKRTGHKRRENLMHYFDQVN
jgi:integrase/recombinase XerD